MADIGASLVDGHSTAGSAGTGLGAISRQADVFAIYSRSGIGTAISARFVFASAPPLPSEIDIGVLRDTYPGETVSGDDWAFNASARGHTMLVVDGSG